MRAIWLVPLPLAFAALGFLPPPRSLARPVELVRVYGGPTEHRGQHSVRVDCFERRGEEESPAADRPFVLTVAGASYEAVCGAGGSVEVPVQLLGGLDPIAITVSPPRQRLRSSGPLAEGRVSISLDQARAAGIVRSARLAGVATGAEFEAYLPGGSLPMGGRGEVFVRVRGDGSESGDTACAGDGHPRVDEESEAARRRGEGRPVHTFGEGLAASLWSRSCRPRGYEVVVEASTSSGALTFARNDRSAQAWGYRAVVPVVAAPSASVRPSRDGNNLSIDVTSVHGATRAHLRIDDTHGRRWAQWVRLDPLGPPGRNVSPTGVDLRHWEPSAHRTVGEVAVPIGFDRAGDPRLTISFDDAPGSPSQIISLREALRGESKPDPWWVRPDPAADLVEMPTLLWVDGLSTGLAAHASHRTRVVGSNALGYLLLIVLELALLRRWRSSRRAPPLREPAPGYSAAQSRS